MRRGREPGHVQTDLGDDRPGELEADAAGDLREPLVGGQHRRAGAGIRDGRRRSRAPGGRDRGEGGLDLVVDGCAICLVQEGRCVQVQPDQHRDGSPYRGVMPTGPLDGGAAALDAACRRGRPGRPGRVRPPAIDASRIARAVLVRASDDAPRSTAWPGRPPAALSSRCHSRVRSRGTSCSRVRARLRSARISGGGIERGAQAPISASRAIHCASSRSVLGRNSSPAAAPATGIGQLHAQPGCPPAGSTRSARVVRRRLHDDVELDLVGQQPRGQRPDRRAAVAGTLSRPATWRPPRSYSSGLDRVHTSAFAFATSIPATRS